MHRHQIAAIIVAPLLLMGFETIPRSVECRSNALLQTQQLLMMACEMYRLDVGDYPTEYEGLQALTTNPGFERWKGPYVEVDGEDPPPDPWGNVFGYTLVDDKPRISSAGPDGVFGTEDDDGNNVTRAKGCTRIR